MLKKYFKKRMRTYVSMLLAITIFVQSLYITPITAHAEIKVPELATSSNALQASPMTLEVPDAAPLAMSGMTAAQWVWRALFSLFGVAVNDDDSLEALSTDVTSYINKTYDKNANIFKTLAKLTTIGWGEILQGCPELKKAIGEYFASKEGFGTSSGLTGVQVPNTNYFTFSDSYWNKYRYDLSSHGIDSSDYLFSDCYRSPSLNGYFNYFDYYLPSDFDYINYKIIVCGQSSSSGYICYYDTLNDTVNLLNLTRVIINVPDSTDIPIVTYETTYVWSFSPGLSDISRINFPVVAVGNWRVLIDWIHQPNIYKTHNNWPIGINGEIWDNVKLNTWVDVQSDVTIQKESSNLTVGEDLTLPSDEQAGTEALENISSAIDIDSLAKSIAEYLNITYEQSGTADDSNTGTITQILSFIKDKISHWDIDIWKDALNNVLGTLGIDDMAKSLGNISNWSIDTLINGATNTITDALASLGINDLSGKLDQILDWNFADWSLGLMESLKKVLDTPFDIITTKLSNLANDIASVLNLSALFKGISDKIFDGTNIMQKLFDYLSGISFTALLLEIIALLKLIPKAIVDELRINSSDTGNETDESFHGFVNYVICLVYIILLLIMIFANCIRLIILIFNIPSSTVLFNQDVLLGLQFTKDLMIPRLNVSLYSLLSGVAFFVCIMSIIAVLKKRIDKLHE